MAKYPQSGVYKHVRGTSLVSLVELESPMSLLDFILQIIYYKPLSNFCSEKRFFGANILRFINSTNEIISSSLPLEIFVQPTPNYTLHVTFGRRLKRRLTHTSVSLTFTEDGAALKKIYLFSFK